MNRMGSNKWKDIPVEGGKCDVHQYDTGIVVAYFFPDDEKTYEEILIGDRAFYSLTHHKDFKIYSGAKELRKRIPELLEADLPEYVKEMLLLKGFREFEGIQVKGGVYDVAVFETGDANRFNVTFYPMGDEKTQESLDFNGERFSERICGDLDESRADKLRENLPELLNSDELTDDVKKALSIIK